MKSCYKRSPLCPESVLSPHKAESCRAEQPKQTATGAVRINDSVSWIFETRIAVLQAASAAKQKLCGCEFMATRHERPLRQVANVSNTNTSFSEFYCLESPKMNAR